MRIVNYFIFSSQLLIHSSFGSQSTLSFSTRHITNPSFSMSFLSLHLCSFSHTIYVTFVPSVLHTPNTPPNYRFLPLALRKKMGNCFVLCRITTTSSIVADDVVPKDGKVLRVVKTDGKVLEFRSPILVKDIVFNFSSFGISVSKQAPVHLPSNYELKLGKVYHMVPLICCVTEEDRTASATTRRIKVVITKQQLQELLTNQISVQKVLPVSGPKIKPCNLVDSSTNWKPKLQSIPEGREP